MKRVPNNIDEGPTREITKEIETWSHSSPCFRFSLTLLTVSPSIQTTIFIFGAVYDPEAQLQKLAHEDRYIFVVFK
jgi:hypothetical protein